MYDGHTVGVVVPAYNEEGYVGPTIDTIPDFADRIYVVEDGSTDGTWAEIVERAESINGSETPEAPGFEDRIVPIRHDENRGVGGAIKTGYLRAREDGVDVTAVMGGDNQMNPDELARYLDPIVRGEADYAKGSRLIRREDWEDMPRFRFVGNMLLSYLTKVASGYWRTLDPQNGYTAISRHALEQVPIEDMYEYYGYCNDLLVKLNVENLRVADVARSSTFAYEEDWKSHIEYREYVPRVSAMLLRNFFFRLNRKYLHRDFHPLALFYYLGMGVAATGLLGIAARVRSGSSAGDGPAALVAGAALFLVAAVLDAEDNRDLELQVLDGDPSETGDREAGARTGEGDADGQGVDAAPIDTVAANGGGSS